MFKAQNTLVLEHKKINDHKSMRKIFHLSAKVIVNDSDIDKSFGSIHQSPTIKIKKMIGRLDC